MSLNIAIIGAGPAGATLARLLHLSPVPISFTIFEGESTAVIRAQGGSLDLHPSTGLLAIQRAGLNEEFDKHCRYDGEALTIADKKFTKYLVMKGAASRETSTGRPEIDRPVLRDMLVKSLPPNTVHWNRKVDRVEPASSHTWNVHFKDGSVEGPFDLVVGADGAWSRVRNALTDVKPYYSGVGGNNYEIRDAEHTAPGIYSVTNRGSMFALDERKMVGFQFNGSGVITVNTWRVAPEESFTATTAAEARKQDLEMLASWAPVYREAVEATHRDGDRWVARPLYMLPVGAKWEHKAGLTLIGDAAHLMTPFAGEGVNAAMKDSLLLSEAIIRAAQGEKTAQRLSEEIRAYEETSFVRNTAVQQKTFDNMTNIIMSPDGVRYGITAWILSALRDEINGLLFPFVAAAVHMYYAVFRLVY